MRSNGPFKDTQFFQRIGYVTRTSMQASVVCTISSSMENRSTAPTMTFRLWLKSIHSDKPGVRMGLVRYTNTYRTRKLGSSRKTPSGRDCKKLKFSRLEQKKYSVKFSLHITDNSLKTTSFRKLNTTAFVTTGQATVPRCYHLYLKWGSSF